MKTIERLAIKYLLIVVGINIVSFFAVYSQAFLNKLTDSPDPIKYSQILYQIIGYSGNIVIGTFILFDSLKYTKNKLIISLVGFLMPVFGVCFLIIEKYLIQYITENE